MTSSAATETLSVPSKVFLLGEYAVLTGTPAWVSAVPPRFVLRGPDSAADAESRADAGFHPESPAGRFISARFPDRRLPGIFVDPWSGKGGFGGSTAEFVFAAHRAGIRSAVEAWRVYRELSRGEPATRRPSGADLVAQWEGGTVEWNPSAETATDLSTELHDLPVLIFSATHLPNRKTVTHSHLDTLANSTTSFESLVPALERARRGARDANWSEVGRAFSAYADSLAHLNLESPVVRNERLALSRRPGVHGAKGCGSLQTDAMLVVVDALDSRETDAVIDFAATECSLRLLSRGLPREAGVRVDA
jgi:hypothetical protein